MRDKIQQILLSALGLKEIDLEVPKDKTHGDYSSNIAMSLSKVKKMPPKKIAEEIKETIEAADKGKTFKKVEIAGPGFINFYLKDELIFNALTDILEKRDEYGNSNIGKGKKVLIEFVSANPTGPLHIGHGRWAAIGESVANILKAVGYSVDKEFYINNVGRQVNLLAASVEAAINGQAVPQDGYGGVYVKEIAQREDIRGLKDIEQIKQNALEIILKQQKETLKALNVNFDSWFTENVLHDKGLVKKTVEVLRKNDCAYEKDGALWFPSTRYGDDKDRVLVRENGDTTYFAADIAYHADKFERGYDLLVNIWGTDHHGYVKRLRSALEALKLPGDKLIIILGQLVTLYRGSEPVRMSKRTGEMITLQEVIDETGADATRFFLLLTGADTHLDFDLELAKQKTMENPVYYVQYAYARLCNILKNAASSQQPAASSQGLGTRDWGLEKTDFSLLKDEAEIDIIKKLMNYPDDVADCAEIMQPHHLVRYSRELAALLHSYYHKQRVICEDEALMKARLALVESTRIVLSNVLKLLGISAPERM